MPLGDSLTSSLDGQASYRYWLWKKLEAHGYSVDFVGTLWGVGDGASGIYGDFDQDHEGHPGATTDDILYGLGSWAAATQPDVVLLLIGGNDFEQGMSPSHALANTHKIIATLREVNPNVAILWAMLPPASTFNKMSRIYNSRAVNLARAWSRKGSPVRVVNLWSNLKPSLNTVDGEHPNALGERKYANRFYNLLVPLVNRIRRGP